jgi:hypothetical protein
MKAVSAKQAALERATEKLAQPQVALPQVGSVQTARQQATQQQTAQQQAAQRPQLSGLVQRNVRPMPHVMNVEKLQQSVNNAVKTSLRPNMNMLLFKNFHQRVA